MKAAGPVGEPLFPNESLTTLRDRLTRMIERNEASGWPERNALPIVVRVRHRTPTGRLRDKFYQFDHASAAMIGVGGRHFGLEVSVRAEHEVTAAAPAEPFRHEVTFPEARPLLPEDVGR